MLQKNDQTKDTNRKSKYWQKSENVSIIQKITNMGTENWHNRQKNQLTNTEKYLTNQTKAWTKKNTQAKKTNKSENPPPKKSQTAETCGKKEGRKSWQALAKSLINWTKIKQNILLFFMDTLGHVAQECTRTSGPLFSPDGFRFVVWTRLSSPPC